MDWGVQNQQVSPRKAGTAGERTANSQKVQQHHQCSQNRASKSQKRVLAILRKARMEKAPVTSWSCSRRHRGAVSRGTEEAAGQKGLGEPCQTQGRPRKALSTRLAQNKAGRGCYCETHHNSFPFYNGAEPKTCRVVCLLSMLPCPSSR